jgi:hypothetical protein
MRPAAYSRKSARNLIARFGTPKPIALQNHWRTNGPPSDPRHRNRKPAGEAHQEQTFQAAGYKSERNQNRFPAVPASSQLAQIRTRLERLDFMTSVISFGLSLRAILTAVVRNKWA